MSTNPETGVASTDLTVEQAGEALMSKWDETPEENPESEEVETEAESTTEIETEEENTEDDEGESLDQEAETEEAEPGFQSVQELADALEMPLDEFLATVKGKVKIDGQESELTLAELRDGYQRDSDYRRKTTELAENRRQFEAQAQQQAQQLNNSLQMANATLQAAEQQMLGEYNNVNWDQLRAENPAEWSARQQEFSVRQAEIQQYQQNIAQSSQQQMQMQQAQQAQAMQQYLANERKALSAAAPDWTSETNTELAGYLNENGFSPDEVGQLVDHRHAIIARKAMLYDQQQKQVNIAKAKVKPLPKMLKPGAKASKTQQAKASTEKLRAKLKRTGSVKDVQALLLDRM